MTVHGRRSAGWIATCGQLVEMVHHSRSGLWTAVGSGDLRGLFVDGQDRGDVEMRTPRLAHQFLAIKATAKAVRA